MVGLVERIEPQGQAAACTFTAGALATWMGHQWGALPLNPWSLGTSAAIVMVIYQLSEQIPLPLSEKTPTQKGKHEELEKKGLQVLCLTGLAVALQRLTGLSQTEVSVSLVIGMIAAIAYQHLCLPTLSTPPKKKFDSPRQKNRTDPSEESEEKVGRQPTPSTSVVENKKKKSKSLRSLFPGRKKQTG